MPLLRLLAIVAAAATAAAQQPAAAPVDGPGVAALLDKVLADPSDAAARERLREAAEAAAAREKASAVSEQAALRTGADRDRKRVLDLRETKDRRMTAWEKKFSVVCSLAGSGETAGQAVAAYERLLENAPVYSDNREQLVADSVKVKTIFYNTIKKEFPYLVQDRTSANERDIAALMFARASETDESGRYIDTSGAQKTLDMAERLTRLERELELQYTNLGSGLELYAKKRYTEAAGFFEEVLAFDSENEEALFYRARAGEEAGAAEQKKDKR